MPFASLLCIISVMMLAGPAENAADKALRDARKFADAGDYAKALERHEWFHKNALAIDPSLCGVRLSFALSDWQDLGTKYPPALKALKRIRDADTKALKSGKGAPELFHDVEAINEHLNESSATIALFKSLHASRPKLAKKCFRFADKALIEAKEFGLFLHYVPDLRTYLQDQIRSHDTATSHLKSRGALTVSTVEHFDQKLVELTLILANLATHEGDSNLATDLKSMASQSVTDPRLGR